LITLDPGVETATLDIDHRGRMWLASDGETDIRVRWSDPPYTSFSDPIVLATGTSTDDICAVVALPAQRMVGVFWSDQVSRRFGFKTHRDDDAPQTWSVDEVPASQSILEVGKGFGDDHMNMAVASDGTLYCATKTSYDLQGYPHLILLRRKPGGQWEDPYEVSDFGTRAIVILNEIERKLKVVFTSVEDGGNILYKETSLPTIAFGDHQMLIEGFYNNATCAKSNYHPDVVILAASAESASATSVAGVLAEDEITVTSVSESLEARGRVYPNPVDREVYIEFGNYTIASAQFTVLDPSGRTVLQETVEIENGIGRLILDSDVVPAGMYFVRIGQPGKTTVVKMIKR